MTESVNHGIAPAGYYEEFYSDRDWRFYAWILAQAVWHSAPGPILDVGAGVGYLTEAAQRWGFDCEGIEGSAQGIEIGRARYPELRLQHHLLSEPFPFESERFQTVFANQVIEHLPPDVGRAMLAEIARVLRPGGMVFIGSPSRFNSYERKADPTHINLYEPKELESLLAEAGLENISDFNTPLLLLGSNKLGSGLMSVLFRLVPWQRLSATANYRAYKPLAGA